MASILLGSTALPRLASAAPALTAERAQALAAAPVWRALLHLHGDESVVADPDFLLGPAAFSPEQELRASIQYLFEDTPAEQRHARICRFPARYAWLAAQLPADEALDPASLCPDIAEFFARAPGDRISLVFASEKLGSASSMMGHVLLKLSGADPQGRPVAHAISYFTNIEGINVPRILFESLVTGKPGYYTLSPYREKEEFYLGREGRNVWEYELEMSPEQRRLLQLHLYELRRIRLTYFFHRHNCATLTADLLSLLDPAVAQQGVLWTSPADVVKGVHAAGLVRGTRAVLASRWRIRMLEQALPTPLQDWAHQAPVQPQPWKADTADSSEGFLLLQLQQARADLERERGRMSTGTHRQLSAQLTAIQQQEHAQAHIDLSGFKAPHRTPQDSQLRVGLARQAGRNWLRLGFLPTAHRLEDDHRQQFDQSELRLADLSLDLDPARGALRLDEFQLYSMATLLPWNAMAGGWSGRFRLGVETHRDAALREYTATNIAGGLGLGFALSRDVLAYGLLGGGLAAVEGRTYGYAEPEAGLIVEEIGAMKTLLSARWNYNQLGSGQGLSAVRLTQIKPFGTRYALVAEVEGSFGGRARQYDGQIALKRYF